MRRLWMLVIVLIGVGLNLSVTLADDSIGWFNYRECDFCKQWASQPGLIAHTRDECLNIKSGIIWMTTVEPDYRSRFESVMRAEDSVSAAIEAGNPARLCEFCKGLGAFLDKGVKMEQVSAKGASLMIFTAPDSSVAQAIQEFGVKALSEEVKANDVYLKSAKTHTK